MARKKNAHLTRTAENVMRKSVITVREDEDVWSVSWTLVNHQITGAPVVDDRGRLVGVISQTDLARYLYNRGAQSDTASPPVTAGQLMTRKLVCASPEIPLAKLADLMLKRRVHRVLITRGKNLIGLVTSMDLVEAESTRSPDGV